MAAEEGAKRMARDIELYKKRDNDRVIGEATGAPASQAGDTVQRGTKDLMRMIQNGISEDQIEDVDIEDAEITEE